MIDLDNAKVRLEERLHELKARQQRIAIDLDEPLNADSSEQAVEMQDDVALEQQAALIAQEIGSVNRAIARVEKGTYGDCILCGDAITEARLAARPEASCCIDCARREQ